MAKLQLNTDQRIYVFVDSQNLNLIEYLEQKEKLSHIIIPNPKKYSALLRKFRKYFVYINNLERKLEKRKNERE